MTIVIVNPAHRVAKISRADTRGLLSAVKTAAVWRRQRTQSDAVAGAAARADADEHRKQQQQKQEQQHFTAKDAKDCVHNHPDPSRHPTKRGSFCEWSTCVSIT